MKIKALVTILSLFAASNSYTAPPTLNNQNNIRITTRPALVGLWGMNIPNNQKCIEYYNFKSNHEVFIKSAEEWSYGLYDYQATLDPALAPTVLILNIRHDNNKIDCSGVQEDQTGEVTRLAITWQNSSNISFCVEDNPNNCFATLRRIYP